MPDASDLARLEELLGHGFADRGLLERALSHRSWANEQRGGARDNETLEFLGDAVLALLVGERLMERFPRLGEGELSIARAQVVSEQGLSGVARDLGLGRFLRLGRGEERGGGRDKPSLLADAFEACAAAIYLDGGLAAARGFVVRHLEPRIGAVDRTGFADAKTRLQESAQAKLHATPEYVVVSEAGPDHDKRFEVGVVIRGREWARAIGKSKKAAEQAAAAEAAFLLDGADLDAVGGDDDPA